MRKYRKIQKYLSLESAEKPENWLQAKLCSFPYNEYFGFPSTLWLKECVVDR